MAVRDKGVKLWTESLPRPQATVDSAAWWLPLPGWLGGVASIGGVFGAIPVDARRFHPAADIAMLRRDGTILAVQFKHAHSVARRELAREENEDQERLFDPDKG
jgi:hypothetical protein